MVVLEEKINRSFIDIPHTHLLSLTHVLFVDYVLIFYSVIRGDIERLSSIIELFSRATDMLINNTKSTLSTHVMERKEVQFYKDIFPYLENPLDEGLKYLGFHLKTKFLHQS